MKNREKRIVRWIYIIAGPILSLIAFVITYYVDPLNFGEQKPLAAMPAFLISVVILIINQNLSTQYELKKSNLYSDRIYEAIKDYLHVTALGSPERAFQYIISRLPALREVKNTTFNLPSQIERAEEKFYDTEIYDKAMNEIATHSTKNLIWKDIGDAIGVSRLRALKKMVDSLSRNKKHGYKYKLINHNEPQLNFIILEYEDGSKEVLFNWDFRGIGQDPTVLVSRERQIIEMFTIHYSHLWNSASPDHDTEATKSDPRK